MQKLYSFIIVSLISAMGAASLTEIDDPTSLRPLVFDGKLAKASDPFYDSTVKIRSSSGGMCSGTLIAPDIVISAGHCNSINNQATAYLGQQVRRVIRQRIHPRFFSKSYLLGFGHITFYDIRVLKLEKPFKAPAKYALLPHPNDRLSPNEGLIIAGFGCMSKRTPKRNGLLSYDYVTGARYIQGKRSESTQINTTGAVCKGDSGGSLYGVRNRTLVLFGVTAWGDDYGFTTRFEALEPHLNWIHSVIHELN